jgi:leucyl/phenylalanyl-tRNA---protein transferase
MAARNSPMFEITPQMLLRAYALGIFPMAESADDPQLYWIEPQARGILPLDALQIPRRLARTVRQDRFQVTIDTDFDGVIDGCAAPRPGRRSTWINSQIRSLYRDLFRQGHCHTVEVRHDGGLVGGLYGVALGGVYFGESMFSTERDASKVGLVHLCARLIHGGFTLLDTQFVTDHLSQFGTVEIDKAEFQNRLQDAVELVADFTKLPQGVPGGDILDIIGSAQSDLSDGEDEAAM